MRGLVMLFLGSVMETPVFFKPESTCSTEALGALDLSTAQAPATWGAAPDVPPALAKPYPGTDDVIHRPGASRSSSGELLEKSETSSVVVSELPSLLALPSSVDPTLTMLEMQAGEPMPVEDSSFPEAAMVAIPTARSLSAIDFRDGYELSHSPGNSPEPKLRLAAAMSKLSLSSSTRSRPEMISSPDALMQGPTDSSSSSSSEQSSGSIFEKTCIEMSSGVSGHA